LVQISSWSFSRPGPALVLALALAASLGGCGGGSVASAPSTGQAPPISAAPPQTPLAAATPTAPQAPVSKVPGASATLGLLLPLSGTNKANADLGQALDRAAQMALFDSADTKTALVVRDTETPQGVSAAAQSAIDEGANILLGPIFADAARQVGPVASGGHVADVAFTNDRSVAGNGVYVMGVLPGLQVDRVIDYASQQGHKSFAALLPDNTYGHLVGDAFIAAVARNQGTVAAAEYYPADAAEFSGPVQKLASDPPFDALLIPVGGFQLRSIVSLMTFYKIDTTQVKLLGTSLWDDPSLAAERALDGAWYAATPDDSWDSFVQRYRAAYAADPPKLAALAYDAVTMAAELAKAGDFSDQALTRPDGFTGVDGSYRFGADGLVQRNLAVYELGPKGATLKDPAAKSFGPVLTN
jgi:branched-chain amino acid transport system substrate-binding protein